MRIAVWAGGLCTAVIAVLLLQALAGSPLARHDLAGTVAYAALCSAPWALAMGGLRHRPVNLAPAGVLAIAVSPLLWSGMLLLLAPGLLYIWAFARARPAYPAGLRRVALTAVPVVLAALAWAVLLSGGEDRCAEDQRGTTCADVVGPVRAALAVGMGGAGVAAGWQLSAPAGDRWSLRQVLSRD